MHNSINHGFQKLASIISKKYTDAANGQSCIRCGKQDGTIVACHYSGLYAHRLGRGAARKCHDIFIADLCYQCHINFDHYAGGNDDARAVDFLICVLLTIERRWRDGIIGILKKGK